MHSDYQDCHHPSQALQEGEYQTIPQLQDQVPVGFQENPTTIQEAQDHIQGQ
jgi:hypothetical protein